MNSKINRQIHLRSRPEGLPTLDNFELIELPMPELVEGEVLVRNIYMSVDPYMRGRMREGKSYTSSFDIGRVLAGGAVGQVVASRSQLFQGGEYVYNEPGSGEMTYSFDNSLFIGDCLVDWDQFNFTGVQIQEQ